MDTPKPLESRLKYHRKLRVLHQLIELAIELLVLSIRTEKCIPSSSESLDSLKVGRINRLCISYRHRRFSSFAEKAFPEMLIVVSCR